LLESIVLFNAFNYVLQSAAKMNHLPCSNHPENNCNCKGRIDLTLSEQKQKLYEIKDERESIEKNLVELNIKYLIYDLYLTKIN
jgi:hypothetical protein